MRKPGSGVELLSIFLVSSFLVSSTIGAAFAREGGIAVAQAQPAHPPALQRAAPAPPSTQQAAPTQPAAPTPRAQTPPPASEPQQTQTFNVSAGTGWVAKCVSESRQSPVECSMEQTLSLPNTGQLVASVLVRVPADTHQPVMMIQLPVGLYIPAGLSLQIDDGKAQPVPLQTCDLKGCYAGMQVSQELLTSLKSGKRLTMTFQNMAKNNVTVPIPLGNFTDAYQKIQ